MSQNRFWYLFAKVLSKEATPSELAEYEHLKAESPHLAYQADYLSRYWHTSGKVDKDVDGEAAFDAHWKQINQLQPLAFNAGAAGKEEENEPRKQSLWNRFGLYATAACFLLVSLGFLWKNFHVQDTKQFLGKKYSEVSTRSGTRTKLVLPDSTIVWLNAGSKLSYSEGFGVKDRNTVLSGEAFFDVRKSTVPFIIHASNITIKVLGTAFNVRSYENEKTTETSLLRGRVQITIDKRPGETFLLKPNEKLIVSDESKVPVQKRGVLAAPIIAYNKLQRDIDSTLPETAWLQNKLVFQNESFEDLAKQMERWYGVTFEFRDASLQEQRLTGSFTNESLSEALEALRITTPFHFKIKQTIVTITK